MAGLARTGDRMALKKKTKKKNNPRGVTFSVTHDFGVRPLRGLLTVQTPGGSLEAVNFVCRAPGSPVVFLVNPQCETPVIGVSGHSASKGYHSWTSEGFRLDLAFGCFCRFLEEVLGQTEAGFGFSAEKCLKTTICLLNSVSECPKMDSWKFSVDYGAWEGRRPAGATWRPVIGRV